MSLSFITTLARITPGKSASLAIEVIWTAVNVVDLVQIVQDILNVG